MDKGFFSMHCPMLLAGFGAKFEGGTANLFPEMPQRTCGLVIPFSPTATPGMATFHYPARVPRVMKRAGIPWE